MNNKNKRKVISLFTGAGGFDYGIEAAGFTTCVAIEMDKWCCETLRFNRDWTVVEDRIENVSSKDILKLGGLKKGEAALLIGGPPCQPFSKSGFWVSGDVKRLEDPRSDTLNQYMRVLEDTLPQAFILENVLGLAYKGKDEGIRYLENALKKINKRNKTKYNFNFKIINSADFGVPQIRERVFIVGSREGKDFNFPSPRFFAADSKEIESNASLQQYNNVWDSIGHLSESEGRNKSKIGGKWGDLLPTIPPGENYLWHSKESNGMPIFKHRSRYWSFLLKLHPAKPSWTIQAQPGTSIGPFHWNNRRLTMEEMAKIQTFPEDIVILGGVSNVQKQIGNAVPSAIGELLGKEIRKQFFGHKVTSKKLSLIPQKNNTPFKIFYSKNVPKQYTSMSLN